MGLQPALDQQKYLENIYHAEMVNFQHREYLSDQDYIHFTDLIEANKPEHADLVKADALSRIATTPDSDSIDMSIFDEDPKQKKYDQTLSELSQVWLNLVFYRMLSCYQRHRVSTLNFG